MEQGLMSLPFQKEMICREIMEKRRKSKFQTHFGGLIQKVIKNFLFHSNFNKSRLQTKISKKVIERDNSEEADNRDEYLIGNNLDIKI
jgi:hypothetical protein